MTTRKLVVIAVVVTLSLPLVAVGLVASEPGSRWLLGIASRLAGDNVSFEHVSGTLLSPLGLSHVDVRQDLQQLKVDRLTLRWRPLQILNGVAHVEQLSMAGVTVESNITGDAPKESTGEFEGIRLPIVVRADEIDIEDIRIVRGNSQNRVEHIHVRDLRADNDALAFSEFDIRATGIQFTSRARIGAVSPNPLDAEFVWSYRGADGATVHGKGEISGDLQQLTVTQRLDAPFSATLSGTVSPLAAPLKFDLRADWRELRWPLAAEEKIRSDAGTIAITGTPEALRVSVSAAVKGAGLLIDRLEIEADGGMVNDVMTAQVRWAVGLVQGGEASGAGAVSGDASRLTVEHQVDAPIRISTRGDILFSEENVAVTLGGEWQEARWPLAGNANITSASGRYQVTGPLDALRFEIDGDVRSPAASIERANISLKGQASAQAPFAFDAELDWRATFEQAIDASGRGSVSGNIERIEFEKFIERPFALTARGNAVLNTGVPTVRLQGSWQDLRWPPSGTPDIVSRQAEFTVNGPMDALNLAFNGDLGGGRLPASRARLDAMVSPTGAAVRSLNIETLGGNIRAAGDVGWSPHPTWRLDVQAANLDPESFAAEWPGDVSLSASVSGGLEADRPRVQVILERLSGQLRGYPIKGGGSLETDGVRVSAKNFILSSGENMLRIDGDASDQLDLGFVIDAPFLEALAPQLRGSLKGNGALSGARTRPRIFASLAGADIAWKESRMQTLALDVNAGTDPGYQSKFALDARGLRIDDSPVENITLEGSGTPESHSFKMTVIADAGTFNGSANGTLESEIWTGTLDGNLATRRLGDWRFEQPARIRAGRDQVVVERACVLQQPAVICAGGGWRAAGQSINAKGEIRALPLALAKPFLPAGIDIDGPLMGDFSLGGRVDAVNADASIVAAKGVMSYQPNADFPRTEFAFNGASLRAHHGSSGTQMQFGVSLDNAGDLRGDLDIGVIDRDHAAPLRGRVDARFSDLAWLSVVLPQVTEVRGELNAGLDIGGNTARPSVNGKAVLRDAQANLPDLGLELRDVSLNVHNESTDRYLVEGGITSGGGRVDLSGQANLAEDGNYRVDFSLKGQDFEIAKLPTAHAFVTPDLQLRADPKLAELSGKIHVPKANIKLKQLPDSAVAISDDEVIVGRSEAENKKQGMPGPRTKIMVDVTLGEEVLFEGFGLFTGIDGNIALSGESGQQPNAQGVLSLRDGRYDAFGQKLNIQRGRLLFTGPIDNPGIDVTAVREIRDITAGIEISGNVRSIRSRVFSDPALPEAEAFAYLLTGRPLSGGSKTDATMLSGAALSLGLQRSQLITKQIGSTLGLDEFTVGGDDVAQSSLLLGKQVTPDLFVRYALGLFQQSGKLLLNYRLTDSLSLEAESGAQQGLDLLYQIERDKLF